MLATQVSVNFRWRLPLCWKLTRIHAQTRMDAIACEEHWFPSLNKTKSHVTTSYCFFIHSPWVHQATFTIQANCTLLQFGKCSCLATVQIPYFLQYSTFFFFFFKIADSKIRCRLTLKSRLRQQTCLANPLMMVNTHGIHHHIMGMIWSWAMGWMWDEVEWWAEMSSDVRLKFMIACNVMWGWSSWWAVTRCEIQVYDGLWHDVQRKYMTGYDVTWCWSLWKGNLNLSLWWAKVLTSSEGL